MKKFLKILSVAIGLVLAFFTAAPLTLGIFHPGTALFALMTLFFLFAPTAWDKVKNKSHKIKKICSAIIALGYGACVFVFVFCGFLAVYGSFNNYNGEMPPTVIVLGCQVHGENPSLTLKYRLDAALEVSENYDCSFVVSGGLTPGDLYSEAEVMKKYLMRKGVNEDKIYIEDKSTNTDENLKFSAKVIENNGLNKDVVICSDKYHLLRASLYGKKYGLNTYVKGGKSPWGLAPTYYAREILGVMKQIIFDL